MTHIETGRYCVSAQPETGLTPSNSVLIVSAGNTAGFGEAPMAVRTLGVCGTSAEHPSSGWVVLTHDAAGQPSDLIPFTVMVP